MIQEASKDAVRLVRRGFLERQRPDIGAAEFPMGELEQDGEANVPQCMFEIANRAGVANDERRDLRAKPHRL